jgi:hypothetical protein
LFNALKKGMYLRDSTSKLDKAHPLQTVTKKKLLLQTKSKFEYFTVTNDIQTIDMELQINIKFSQHHKLNLNI